MKILGTFLTLLALPLLAASPALGAPAAPALLPYESAPPAATHPSLYSFADACRLALSGEQALEVPRFSGTPGPVRVVSRPSAAETAQPRFSVSAPRDGSRWPLVLAGLFACAWVAHRRLTSPY
jgi:hypothetical protein